MKKIMIALTVVAMAVVANAATVNWNSGTIYRAGDASGADGAKATMNSVTAYLYALTAEQYIAAQSMDTATLYSTYSGTTATVTKNAIGNGTANIIQNVADASGMHYGLVLYVDTANANIPEGKDAFVKAALGTADVGGATGITIANMITTSAVSSTWTAVPEPTSGLLMLVGLGALALRRRRA